jgi:KamA family protein
MSTYRLTATRRAPVTKAYKAYHGRNFREIPQISRLSKELLFDIDVVSQVLPFKVNNFVVDHLIDWDDVPNDPLYNLTFPRREMLAEADYMTIAHSLRTNEPANILRHKVEEIRRSLNPHPAGQLEFNIPDLDGTPLQGMQHKYRETVLFFPSQGQTCHAYCTFCFRWPQFIGPSMSRFAVREAGELVAYLRQHPHVTDVLFTGGDPMIMSARNLASYIIPLLDAGLPHLQRIRIGTKAFSYWPYRFASDPDSPELLALFRRIVRSGIHLAVMAHFNHPRELQPDIVQEAIAHVRDTGAEIRTQSPLLRHINDDPNLWAQMWREQVNLGCIPYYMFLVRDTGAHDHFSVPLVQASRIYQDAYNQVSGLSRTVRGPSMSATPGKVEIVGVSEVAGERVITLRFLQGREPTWALRPFFAQYDEGATWLDDLKPAFGERAFFFEKEPVKGFA